MSSTSTPASPVPGPAPANADFINDVTIRAAWHRFRDFGLRYRASSLRMRAVRAELGAILAQKHAALAQPGSQGGFHQWLRLHKIPRTTAYRLIRLHQTPPPPPPALAELDDGKLTLTLTHQQVAIWRRALAARLAPNAPDFDIRRFIAETVTRNTYGDLLERLRFYWSKDPSQYSRPIHGGLKFRIPLPRP